MATLAAPPEDHATRPAEVVRSIPKETTRRLMAQARLDLTEYFDSAPGTTSIIKAKMRELIAELDKSQHKVNMDTTDQNFVLNAGDLVGHRVHWKNEQRTWY